MKIKWGDMPLDVPVSPMSLQDCLSRYGHSVPDGDLALIEKTAHDEQLDDEEE